MARVRRFRVPKFCAVCGTPRARNDWFCASCGVDFVQLDAGEIDPAEQQQALASSGPAPAAATPAAAAPAAPPPAVHPTAAPPPVSQPTPAPTAPAASPPVPPAQAYAPGPPTAPPATPAPRTRFLDVRFGGIGLTIRLLPIAGGVATAVATALDWLPRQNAYDIPFVFLFDRTPELGGFKLGIAVLLVGIAGAVLSLLPGTSPLRRLCGLAVMAAVAAFCVQVGLLVDDGGGTAGDFFENIEAGVYVALAGGFLLATQR